jgi:hypothetical protein
MLGVFFGFKFPGIRRIMIGQPEFFAVVNSIPFGQRTFIHNHTLDKWHHCNRQRRSAKLLIGLVGLLRDNTDLAVSFQGRLLHLFRFLQVAVEMQFLDKVLFRDVE